jgi:hypothetical protein
MNMSQPVRSRPQPAIPAISLQYGKVLEPLEPGWLRLETAAGIVKATRAANCLVEPEPGDLALLSADEFGRAYLLAVLERAGQGPVALTFEHDVDLKAPAGRMRIAAGQGVELVAGPELQIAAGKLGLHAAEAEVCVPQMSYYGQFLEAQVERIKLFGEACDSVFERVSQRVQRSYRWVAELDQLHAGHLNYLVKKLMSLRGQYAVVTAEKDVRIDGDKILMG